MNTPPPYYAQGPRKSNVGLIIAIIVGVLAVCCIGPGIVGGFFIKGVVKNALGYVGCGWSMDQMRNGLLAYAKAHDGKLPGKDHWQDDIASYIRPLPANSGISLPPENGDVCDMEAGSSATYNEALAGKKLTAIQDPSSAIILWEQAGKGKNRSGKFSPPNYGDGPKLVGNIPRGWIQQPVYGNAYFVDQTGKQSPIPGPGTGGSGGNITIKGPKSEIDIKPGSSSDGE